MTRVPLKLRFGVILKLSGLMTVMLAALVFPQLAHADDWNGRADNFGYFSNVPAYPPTGCPYSMRGANNCGAADDGQNFVLPADTACGGSAQALPVACVNSVNQLYNLLFAYNNSGNLREHASSAFIVQSLLGRDGAQANANGGRNISNADWADLKLRLQSEQAAGQINWNKSFTSPSRSYAMFINSSNLADVTHYTDPSSPQVDPAIIFYNKAGKVVYVLFRPCANPGGNLDGLPRADFKVTVNGFPTGTNNVIQGGSYTLTVRLHNNGPADSTAGQLQVQYPGAAVVRPCAPNCSPPLTPATPGQSNLLSGFSSSRGYRSGSSIPGVAGTNWFWATKSMNSGDNTSGTINFTISPTAPLGLVTFKIYYYSSDEAGATASDTVVFNVVSARYPTLSGANSDIHAGGGLCLKALTNGFVQGHAGVLPGSTASYGEYVVSVSTAPGFSNFSSNGNAPAAQAKQLNLGLNGGYAQTCRPDLLMAANIYRLTGGAAFTPLPGGNYDISGWSGVYYIAGDANIHGTVNSKTTIVSTAGNVHITAPGITLANASQPDAHLLPSLGIIAANDILISKAVVRVDAYMFADGIIDTCEEGQSSATACSTPQLQVNGFLMARDIAFRRLGVLNSNGTGVAEKVAMSAQIYLNPPMFFDSSVDDLLLEGEGERQPLY